MTSSQRSTTSSDALAATAPMSRRTALAALASFGAAAVLAACGSDTTTAGSSTSTTATATSTGAADTTAATTTATTATAATTGTTATDAASCVQIPEETAGPYPGDGSNGANVLGDAQIVRQDIRTSYGSSTTAASGIPLTIQYTLVDTANGCAPLAGAAVYTWHADSQGRYSLYSNGVTGENYLRGVQESDANGVVTFTSVFPAAYDGRWPHVHFEVYKDLAAAKSVSNKIATSQIALPKATCDLVYATDQYPNSAQNLAKVSLTTDMVFRDDGGVHELATVTGNVTDGFVAALTVAV
jgi:protocatechuate 3,4-dioxygenase beta subunit